MLNCRWLKLLLLNPVFRELAKHKITLIYLSVWNVWLWQLKSLYSINEVESPSERSGKSEHRFVLQWWLAMLDQLTLPWSTFNSRGEIQTGVRWTSNWISYFSIVNGPALASVILPNISLSKSPLLHINRGCHRN